MAKYTEFYKGRRKRRNYVFIPTAIVLGLIPLTLLLFYGLQQYAALTKDQVEVKVPLLDNGENTVIDAQGNEVTVFDQVDAQIVFDAPDYSGVEAVAGQGVGPIRAIFVPYTDLNTDKLEEYAGRLRAGNALVLEMKPRQGTLMWSTQSSVAQNYLLNCQTFFRIVMAIPKSTICPGLRKWTLPARCATISNRQTAKSADCSASHNMK